MLWKVLGHHEESIEGMKDALKSGDDDDRMLGMGCKSEGAQKGAVSDAA